MSSLSFLIAFAKWRDGDKLAPDENDSVHADWRRRANEALLVPCVDLERGTEISAEKRGFNDETEPSGKQFASFYDPEDWGV